MIKNAVLIAWILIGSLGATYYFSPAAQRARQLSGLGPLLSQIQLARSEAYRELHVPSRNAERVQAALAKWQSVLKSARAQVPQEAESATPQLVLLRVYEAELHMQDGRADEGLRNLLALEKEASATADAQVLETVQAALAQAYFQIALQIRAQSTEDELWRKYAEKACAICQQLESKAQSQADIHAYRCNLANVSRFLYGEDNGDRCWARPANRLPIVLRSSAGLNVRRSPGEVGAVIIVTSCLSQSLMTTIVFVPMRSNLLRQDRMVENEVEPTSAINDYRLCFVSILVSIQSAA